MKMMNPLLIVFVAAIHISFLLCNHVFGAIDVRYLSLFGRAGKRVWNLCSSEIHLDLPIFAGMALDGCAAAGVH